jgi:hypothetical protein
MAAGLLILRVVVGGLLVGHGTQKLFGWFGGHGPRATGAFFELLGYRPGVLFAVIAGLTEAGGGMMLAVGLLTPLALSGPGPVSADRALGLDWSAAWGIGAVAIGVIAAITTLLLRQPIPALPDATSRDEPIEVA